MSRLLRVFRQKNQANICTDMNKDNIQENKYKVHSFDEYIRQGEPSQREAAYAWSTAIGLQTVDGLKTSEYLNDLARRNIEGESPSMRWSSC